MPKTTVRAGSNIAFIKYWGVVDAELNLPQNSSISMTLADAHTTTTVDWHAPSSLPADDITIDGRTLSGEAGARIVRHLDRIRALTGTQQRAKVVSQNNFPMASGIASSASGFAALTVAATAALGLEMPLPDLCRLARLASGSATRSLLGGFVLWDRGDDDETSIARQIFPPDYWDLYDVVAIVSRGEKAVSSAGGHRLAATSPLNAARVAAVEGWLPDVQEAITRRDLAHLGPILELDALTMHAVMQTSTPSLLYWQPGTVQVLHAVRAWREQGLAAYFTLDAGPNVHILCAAADADEVQTRLSDLSAVEEVLISRPGPGPQFLADHLF